MVGINEKLVNILITAENSVDDDQDNQYLHAERSPIKRLRKLKN